MNVSFAPVSLRGHLYLNIPPLERLVAVQDINFQLLQGARISSYFVSLVVSNKLNFASNIGSLNPLALHLTLVLNSITCVFFYIAEMVRLDLLLKPVLFIS